MARLSDGSGAARFALKTLQSSALCGAVISALNSLIRGEYPHSKVRQKSTDNTFACTLALYHIKLSLSIEIQTFVCRILSDYGCGAVIQQ